LSYMAFRFWADLVKNQKTAFAMLSLLIAFYGIATFQRNRIWQTEVALWYDSVLKSPAKIRPRLNLAGAYFNQKAYDLAIQQYLHVITLNPSIAECHSGLGISYLRKGEVASAEESFHRALALKPELVDPKTGLGIIRFKERRWEDALAYFKQVYYFRRESLQLAYMMSESYIRLGLHSEAIPILQQAIALYPSRPELQQKLEQAKAGASAAQSTQ
jgi:protein O-mannosyl-transferase